MKKLFTLLAAFAACYAANAADYDFDLSSVGCDWGETTYDAATHTLTYGKAWTGNGWWTGDLNLSAYDQLAVEFEEPTSIYVQVVVQFNSGKDCVAGNGAGATKIVCDLTAEKNSVKAVIIQNGNDKGSVKLKRVYCPEVLQYQAPVDLTSKVVNNVITSDMFNGYSDQARVKVTYTATGTADYQGWGIGEIRSLGGKINAFTIQGKSDGESTANIALGDLKAALNDGPDANGNFGLLFNFYGQTAQGTTCTLTLNSLTIEEVVGFTGQGYVAPVTNSINAVSVTSNKLVKTFKNGKIVIYNQGKCYNLLGEEIK